MKKRDGSRYLIGSLPYFYSLSGLSSALVRIFNAIPSPSFSAAVELRALTHDLYNFVFCSGACPDFYPFSKVVLNTSSPPGFAGFPRRTTREG
jgi:hypothetical protein